MRKLVTGALCLTAILALSLAPDRTLAASASPQQVCSRVVNDDTIRPYTRSLKSGFLNAYRRAFPDAKEAPDEAELKTASYRCMDGHLMACFVGANLPCAKIDTSKRNRGATGYCRRHRNEDIVPMSATGHDALYTFSCVNGEARVKEQTWTLDHRGFASEIWKPIE